MRVVTLTEDANHSSVTRLYGFSIRESAGSAGTATVNFRNGAVGGQIIFTLELAANESAALVLQKPIPAADGVYVQVVAGEVTGVLYG